MPGREYDEAQQLINVDRAGQEWTDAARQSFQALSDQTVRLQESNLRLTQNFFQQFVEQLQNQTEGNRQATETLQQQGQRQQQAFQTLAQETANAYSDFLNSAMSFYQQTVQQATEVAQSNMQRTGQVARHGIQASSQAAQAAQQGIQALGQAAQQQQEGVRPESGVAEPPLQKPEDPNQTGAERGYSHPSSGPLIGRSHDPERGDVPVQHEEIENRIRTRIGEDPRTSDLQHLNVEVNDDVAVIRGVAPSQDAKEAVGEIAADTPGVREVRNLITVAS
jgi:hypothetical protein